tara:strand:- start:8 stop:1357 length:1350 start_codon:yes stop_codon:yes gene_type:complete
MSKSTGVVYVADRGKIPPNPTPSMIKLRDYQKEAADKLYWLLARKQFAYLSGEVRTGKTLTALSLIERLGIQRCLLVTKKKAIASIEKDAKALGIQDRIIIINYERLPKFAWTFWQLLIVDEAHCIGAYPKPSGRWKNLRKMSYEKVLMMSGTPSPESFSQLFHQYTLHRPVWAQYKNFYEWAKKYVSINKQYVGTGQTVNDYSNANEKLIMQDIKPFVVQMTQEDAGFETKIDEAVRYVEMNETTYQLAQDIIDDGISTIEGQTILADTGAKKLSKLKQLYCGTVIGERSGKGIIFDRSKAEYIKQRYGKHKIAIMYCYEAERKMLYEAFPNATDSPEEFNANKDAVFIGQVRASREGVNLSTATYLVFLGVDFAALSYLQAKERLSFLGRDTPPRIRYVFAANGIETRIYSTVRKKENFTISHYNKVRGELSSQAGQKLRERRMGSN